ncbi:hypothetical protein CSC33_5070 [Pseudomonas aeruginosa]|nr:hypothetical protein CSC33_5070 [Pseudomonas aeruginosa]
MRKCHEIILDPRPSLAPLERRHPRSIGADAVERGDARHRFRRAPRPTANRQKAITKGRFGPGKP